MTEYLLIEGMTEEGRRFRPGDWADRLASTAATFSADRRLRYSPLLRPLAGRGLLLALRLQQENPALWRQVMDFARANRLRINKGLVHSGEPPVVALAMAS